MDTVFANPDSVCLEIKQAPTDLQCSNKIEILNVASSFLSGVISGPKSTETARGRDT
jgi:hypothetical protein